MAAREQARVRVSALRQRIDRAARYERLGWARRGALNEDTVLYESFSGNGMLCNPEAIFRALLAADDMRHLKHIWVLADFEQYASTIAEFEVRAAEGLARGAEVDQHRVAALPHEDVVGLDVAVQEAGGMDPGEAVEHPERGVPRDRRRGLP